MSGGSFNYLCFKDAYEIAERKDDIKDMRDELIDLGHLDAAKETESVLLMIDSYEVRMQARIDRLNGIWKAVEWSQSGDWGSDSVDKAVKEYRGEK